MADIAASNITYTIVNSRKLADSRNSNLCRLAFGNGALTYPASGIPITKGKLGCPTIIESMAIVDKGVSGYSFMYDQSAEKIVMFQAPAQTHAHNLFIRDNTLADGATTRINAGANVLSANTGANITVTGNTTTGGVLNATLAAAALVEPSAVAIAAQTIEVEVIGW